MPSEDVTGQLVAFVVIPAGVLVAIGAAVAYAVRKRNRDTSVTPARGSRPQDGEKIDEP